MKLFKFLPITLLLLFTTLIVIAQTTEETRNLRDFSAVKVSQAIKAELVRGDENKILIKAIGIDIGKVETSVVADVLEVRLARGNHRNHSVSVVVTYKDIQGIEANTSARVVAKDPIIAIEGYIISATSAYVEAEVEAETFSLDVATSARIVVSGEVYNLPIRAFTNGEIEASKLKAKGVSIQANTAATINVHATNSIVGSAATAAKITYSGDPTVVEVSTNTGGSVRPR